MSDAEELERLRRLDALDELLPTLAGVLDLREVFGRVSDIAQRVLPHQGLAVILVSDDRLHAVPFAVRVETPWILPSQVSLADIPHVLRYQEPTWKFAIIDDMQALPEERPLPPAQMGYRAALRVPIRINGELVGVMGFMSSTPGAYREPDALIARRIADYMALALSHQRLSEAAERAAEARERAARLETRVQSLSDELSALGSHHRVVGESAGWRGALKQATQVASTDTTVLLQGESGTGKEVVARFIHRASPRRSGPLVAVNCAALPDHLLESELFGYERGAFTGATQAKPGQIELAAGGTLFLDEVAEMSPPAQAKLLRVLQEREVQRLGSTKVRRADVRVIAATNRDLRQAMERGTLREDLFYRLHVFGILLPPLRERRDDVLPLSEAFLQEIGRTFGRPPAGISREAREALLAHTWPGNVRELRNTLERAAIVCEGGLILAEHLGLRPAAASTSSANVWSTTAPSPAYVSASAPASTSASTSGGAFGRAPVQPPHAMAAGSGHASAAAAAPAGPASTPAPTGVTDLHAIEKSMIERALADARHNKSHAARLLGLTRTQFYVRLRRHGLDR
jgi:transcriptional regulator with GAF, ATPase, and Fis domain